LFDRIDLLFQGLTSGWPEWVPFAIAIIAILLVIRVTRWA